MTRCRRTPLGLELVSLVAVTVPLIGISSMKTITVVALDCMALLFSGQCAIFMLPTEIKHKNVNVTWDSSIVFINMYLKKKFSSLLFQ